MRSVEDIMRDAETAPPPSAPIEAPKPVPGSVEDIMARDPVVAPLPHRGVTGETPWSEVLTTGAKNIPSDIVHTATDVVSGLGSLASGVMHPQETYEGLRNADWGKIGEQLKHDYLTEEGWKQGIAERPVSRLLDVSTVLAGPEALAARSGISGLQKAAKVVRAIDPANLAIKGVGAGVRGIENIGYDVVGHMTGTGPESLKLLHQSGAEGMAKDAISGLRTKADATEAVKGFEQALNTKIQEKNIAYRSDKNALSMDRQNLDFAPIYNAIHKAEADFSYMHSTAPNVARDTIDNIRGIVDKQAQAANEWQRVYGAFSPHNPYASPIAMDELKKSIGDIVHGSTGPSEAAASRIEAAIGDHIKAQAPIYHKMMDEYAGAEKAIKAYKKELSLGKDPDTALRKLYSALRNNVTANYRRRWQLVKSLADNYPEARRALYNLAGQTNSAWTPRGLVGAFQTKLSLPTAGYAAYAGVNPWLIPLGLGIQSPRLMGELAVKSGQIGRGLGRVPWRPFIYAGHAMGSPYAYSTMTPNSEVE